MADENAMNQGPSVAPKAREDFRSAASATADEYLTRGKDVWTDATARVRGFQDDINQYVRENPAKAVFTALAIGFVVGVLRRR